MPLNAEKYHIYAVWSGLHVTGVFPYAVKKYDNWKVVAKCISPPSASNLNITTTTTTLWPCVYLTALRRYVWCLKDNGVTTLTFWGHTYQSRDHLTRGGRLLIGGSLWKCIYLAPLQRYGASKYMYPNKQTHRTMDTQNNQSHNLLQCSLCSHLAEIIKYLTI